MPSTGKKLLNCILHCGCRRLQKSGSQASHQKRRPRQAPSETTTQSIGDDEDEHSDDEEFIQVSPNLYHPNPNNHPPTTSPYFPEFGVVQPKITTRVVSPCRKITNSVAFVKETEDPHRDFRRSMLQMIFDREIKSREDLQELLNCFLQLNSPSHHDAIIQAFSEIWNSVFSDKNKVTIA